MPNIERIVLTNLDWLAIQCEGYDVKTMKNHRGRINKFLRWCEENDFFAPVTLDIVRYFLAHLYQEEYISIPQYASSILRGGFEENFIRSVGNGFDEQKIYWLRFRVRKMVSRPPFKAQPVTIDVPHLVRLSPTELGWIALWLCMACRADTFKKVHASDISIVDATGTAYSLLNNSLRAVDRLPGCHLTVRIRKDKKELRENRVLKIMCNCEVKLQRHGFHENTFCLIHNKNLHLELPPDEAHLRRVREWLQIAEHAIRRTAALQIGFDLFKGVIWLQRPLLNHMGWGDLQQLVHYVAGLTAMQQAALLPIESLRKVFTVDPEFVDMDAPLPVAPKAKAKAKAGAKRRGRPPKSVLLDEDNGQLVPDGIDLDFVAKVVEKTQKPIVGAISNSDFVKQVRKLEEERQKIQWKLKKRDGMAATAKWAILDRSVGGSQTVLNPDLLIGDEEEGLPDQEEFNFTDELLFNQECDNYADFRFRDCYNRAPGVARVNPFSIGDPDPMDPFWPNAVGYDCYNFKGSGKSPKGLGMKSFGAKGKNNKMFSTKGPSKGQNGAKPGIKPAMKPAAAKGGVTKPHVNPGKGAFANVGKSPTWTVPHAGGTQHVPVANVTQMPYVGETQPQRERRRGKPTANATQVFHAGNTPPETPNVTQMPYVGGMKRRSAPNEDIKTLLSSG